MAVGFERVDVASQPTSYELEAQPIADHEIDQTLDVLEVFLLLG